MFGMGTGVTLPLWPPDSDYEWDCVLDVCYGVVNEVMYRLCCITGFRLDLIRKGTDG